MVFDIHRRLSSKLWGHSHCWRRYLPLVGFVFVITFLHFYSDTGNTYIIQKTIRSLKSLKFTKNSSDSVLHILLVSYARTGSSFVGDMLQSLPDTFYHFEPLHFLSNPVLSNNFEEARTVLNKIFTCNVTSIQGFLLWQRRHQSYMKFKRSFTYWKKCSALSTCYNGSYIDSYCHKHKIIVIKTIRFKLKEAAKLFTTHPNLNLKIIYLSRDPRGALNSRMKFPVSLWCKKDPMCSNHSVYCSALNEDLQTVCSLSKERPNDFMVIRYEDLSLDPPTVTNRLLKFLGFSYIPENMGIFLQTHTAVIGNLIDKSRIQGIASPYSTFRNSSITAMSWRQQMTFQQLIAIQNSCQNVLNGLGYYSYSTMASLRSNLNFDNNLDDAIVSSCYTKK